MKSSTIRKLNQLNQKFYQAQAKSFSDTREVHWPGWERLLTELSLKKREKLRIMDVGCGNGRFLQFLKANKVEVEKYLGIDSSVELIKIARERYGQEEKVMFEVVDILEDEIFGEINDNFDLIAVFGLMHHIPGYENRLELVESLAGRLSPEGQIVLTLWQFRKSSRFDKMILSADSFDFAEELEKGDHLLDWDKSGLPRYCHHFADEEVEKLKSDLAERGLKTLSEYSADGKEGDLNKYLILQNAKK